MHIWHLCLVTAKVLVDILGDSSKFTNYILDSGATCNMTPQLSDFIPDLLEDTDKYTKVADGN